MMLVGGVQEQVFKRPEAEECFRPWWDVIEDAALATMVALGKSPLSNFKLVCAMAMG